MSQLTKDEVIEHFASIDERKKKDVFVTTAVRKELLVGHQNTMIRKGRVIEFIWKSVGGGVWTVNVPDDK
jgi:hypothetical protein